MKAAHALGMIGLPAKASAPEIVKVLEQATDHDRIAYVARALGNTGDPASLKVLYATLKKETDAGAQRESRHQQASWQAVTSSDCKADHLF